MNRINQLFQDSPKNLLSVYFCAGFPTLNSTADVIRTLEKNGVNMVEIGIPFSDPMADGIVIQDAATRALRNGMSLRILFEQRRAKVLLTLKPKPRQTAAISGKQDFAQRRSKRRRDHQRLLSKLRTIIPRIVQTTSQIRPDRLDCPREGVFPLNIGRYRVATPKTMSGKNEGEWFSEK